MPVEARCAARTGAARGIVRKAARSRRCSSHASGCNMAMHDMRGPHGQVDMDGLREGIIALARDAAARILTVYDSEFAVEHKDDKSPLTAADLAAHHCIVAGLERLTPDIPVLSEESAEDVPAIVRRAMAAVVAGRSARRHARVRQAQWRVHRQHRADRRRRAGPGRGAGAGDRAICGMRSAGRGAFRRDGDDDVATAQRACRHRRRCASRPAARIAIRAPRRCMQRMGDIEPVPLGSSLKFCRLAEGGMDVYPRFGPTSEWDTAAGQCVLEAAGGVVHRSARPAAALQPARHAAQRRFPRARRSRVAVARLAG